MNETTKLMGMGISYSVHRNCKGNLPSDKNKRLLLLRTQSKRKLDFPLKSKKNGKFLLKIDHPKFQILSTKCTKNTIGSTKYRLKVCKFSD